MLDNPLFLHYKAMDKDLAKILAKLDKDHKDLTTKYRVLVKRTSSIISTLKSIDTKINNLLDKLSIFEILDEDIDSQTEWNPYDEVEPEDFEDYDKDDGQSPETD
jgi:hypothetical protein